MHVSQDSPSTDRNPPARSAIATSADRSRVSLRAHLARDTPFPRESIERLVRYAEFESPNAAGELCASHRASRYVRVSMRGALKLVCQIPKRFDQVVRYFAPGRFLCVVPMAANRGYRMAIVAHEDARVALLRYEDFDAALSLLGKRAALVHSWGFRRRMLDLCDVAVMLRLPLRERLMHALRHLATELPDSAHSGPGIAVAPPISHDDLADLTGNSRSAVSRELKALARGGLVLPAAPQRIVVSPAVLDTDPSMLVASLSRPAGA